MINVDGHVALIPVALNVGGHGGLRPNDPVPVPGREAREKAISGITTFCTHLNVPVPPLDILLPPSLFPESGTLLRQLRRLSKFLASFQYIRIVDKGFGELWGFCSAWVWEKVTEFMTNQNSTTRVGPRTSRQTQSGKQSRVWSWNEINGGNCAFSMSLQKAKSRRTRKWVFRGISAYPAPILQ